MSISELIEKLKTVFVVIFFAAIYILFLWAVSSLVTKLEENIVNEITQKVLEGLKNP